MKAGRLELLIGAAIVLLAAVLMVEHRYTSQTFDSARAWSSVLSDVRVHTAESHLWLEERLAGDQSIDAARQVFGNIEDARAECRALSQGGPTHFGQMEGLPAGQARDATAAACQEIAAIGRLASARLRGGGGDVAIAADQAYHATFDRLGTLSAQAQQAIERHMNDRRAVAERVVATAITGLVLLLGGVVILVRRHQGRVGRLATRNEAILSAAGDGICGLDHAGRINFANPAAARMLGHEAGELVGRSLHATAHHSRPDGTPYPEEECPVSASLEDGTVHRSGDEAYWRQDGTNFPIEITSTPILEDGEVTGAVVVFRDITERMQAQAALAASERQTRAILDTAHDAFVAIDAGGTIMDWNPQAAATFGWLRGEALGRELAETIIPERHRVAHRRGLERFLATGEGPILGRRLELTALHCDGREFPVELTISALENQDGCVFHAFVRDISERKAVEELLKRQRRQLVEAQSVGGFGSWAWDIASDTTEWSDQLYRIYGLEPGQGNLSFDDFLQLVHEDDRAHVKTVVQTAFETGEPSFSFDHRIVRPDGIERVVQGRGEVVTAEDGTPLRMLGTGQDITERREVERAKEEFTSMVSHELRTPLTSIRGSLGLLASGTLGPLSDQAQRMADIAVHNSDRLVRLINDILDVERMESGKVTLECGSCDLEAMVGQAAEVMRPMAAEAGVELSVEAPSATVWADCDRILQTLTNLLSNAIKFSEPGGRVRLEVQHRDGEVEVLVHDEGRGIPQDRLEAIFDRFEQVDASDAREKGGSGLGLAICRSIVEAHGGRIWALSDPDEGSTLSFTLPDALEAIAPVLTSCGEDAVIKDSVRPEDLEQRVIDLPATVTNEKEYADDAA